MTLDLFEPASARSEPAPSLLSSSLLVNLDESVLRTDHLTPWALALVQIMFIATVGSLFVLLTGAGYVTIQAVMVRKIRP